MSIHSRSQAGKGRVLVVDDHKSNRRLLRRILEEDGYVVKEANDGTVALDLTKEESFHLVISDLKMPRLSGMELLQKIKSDSPETLVILLTAHGTIQSAVEAMKCGAFDYLCKPLADPEEVRLIVERAMKQRRLVDENAALRTDEKWELIYEDEKMAAVAESIRAIAPSDATVLITGESGTGKEVVARLIHGNSGRALKPFVAVNCAALPETLLESELFGHERGAFTGADRQRRGRFEISDKGTLFLDEIGEMSPNLQAKLLRVMQLRSFERVGGTTTITVDVRILAASNRNLKKEIAAGRFREDLFYRLNVVPIELPPLRERGGDIQMLANHFLASLSRYHGREISGYHEDTLKVLSEYHWPGNVRELYNTVERAVILCKGDIITPNSLFINRDHNDEEGELPLNLKDLERDAILRALEKSDGSRREAADILGISLRTLHYKLNFYDLRDFIKK